MKSIEFKKEALSLVKKRKYSIYSKWIKEDPTVSQGEFVKFVYKGETIGFGFYERIGSIGARVLSYISEYDQPNLEGIVEWRLKKAFELKISSGERKEWGFRLLYADADGTPGLVVDLYNNSAVVQTSSYGWDKNIMILANKLVELGISKKVYLKNDQRGRKKFGLNVERRFLIGGDPPIEYINEGKAKIVVNYEMGQKTGFYLDQRKARIKISELKLDGKSVLDLFSYTGAFSLHALYAGADDVLLVEEDERALSIAKENFTLNDFSDKYELIRGRVEKVLDMLAIKKRRFGLIIADPPAFIASKTNYEKGLRAYEKLFSNVVKLSEAGSYIYASSCSYHLNSEELLRILNTAAKKLGYTMRIIFELSPYNSTPYLRPEDEELKYLKGFLIYLE